MPTTVSVQPGPGLASWSYDEITVGQPTELKLTKEQASAVAAAVAAGALELIEGDLPQDAVEPDEVSLEKQVIANEARALLYADRDQELSAVSRAVVDANAERPRDKRMTNEMLQARVEQVRAEKLDEWEVLINAAAQDAIERA